MRILAGELRLHGREIRLRLSRSDALFQPADSDIPGRLSWNPLRICSHRHPQVDLTIEQSQGRGHDTHDLQRPISEAHYPLQDTRIAIEMAVPVAIADEHDAPCRILGFRKAASHGGRDAPELDEISGYRGTTHTLGKIAGGVRDVLIVVAAELLEGRTEARPVLQPPW